MIIILLLIMILIDGLYLIFVVIIRIESNIIITTYIDSLY